MVSLPNFYNESQNPQRTSDYSISQTCSGVAGDPVVPLADYVAPIRWSFAVTIDSTNPSAVTATITGTHTCYPAHEVYVNGQTLWLYGPGGRPGPGNPSTAVVSQDSDTNFLFNCLTWGLRAGSGFGRRRNPIKLKQPDCFLGAQTVQTNESEKPKPPAKVEQRGRVVGIGGIFFK